VKIVKKTRRSSVPGAAADKIVAEALRILKRAGAGRAPGEGDELASRRRRR